MKDCCNAGLNDVFILYFSIVTVEVMVFGSALKVYTSCERKPFNAETEIKSKSIIENNRLGQLLVFLSLPTVFPILRLVQFISEEMY
jgi:archaellum biogenesis protein FlaJ (TadC family)